MEKSLFSNKNRLREATAGQGFFTTAQA